MPKRVPAIVLLLALVSTQARAQIPVTDVAGLAQLIHIVRNVQEIISIMKEEYQTIQRIARGYGGSLFPYRVPSLPPLNHDAGKYDFARLLLDALNTGDPRGEKYTAVVRKVIRPGGLFDALPADAQAVMRSAFANIEVADSVATLGIHESSLARGYALRIGQLIERLQDDVTAGGSEMHEVTAIADKLAVGAMIDARLSQNSNQILSSILEQQLAKNLRQRNAMVAQMNMELRRMEDHGDSTEAIIGNATGALQNWRLR